MKSQKLPIIMVASLILTMPACYFGPAIYGDGNVVTEERNVDSFNGIKGASGLKVFITQGNEESVKVIADQNLQDIIKTEVIDGKLKIYTEYNIRDAKSKEVHVVFKDIHYLSASSGCHLQGENTLETKDIGIDVSSGGRLKLDINASQIDCDASSGGEGFLKGTAGSLDINASSGGGLDASELVAKKAHVDASSGGRARANATDSFELNASSGGNISYTGPGSVDRLHTSSGGNIRKR